MWESIISGSASILGGLYGLRKERRARKREAAASIEDLNRSEQEETRRFGEDVGALYGSAASELASGNIKSSYLQNMQQQTTARGLSNIRRGYQGQRQSIYMRSR